MNITNVVVALFSVLIPMKGWYSPDQPLMVQVRPPAGQEIVLVLTDFTGKLIESTVNTDISGEKAVDLKELFQSVATPGTYVLWAVPKGQAYPAFVGTPLVVDVRSDKRRDAPPGPVVTRVVPLSYGVISTEHGDITVVFYYDAAPTTVGSFVALARDGFYDGLTFHRIIPGFVVQGGDPRGDGTGGPGYNIDAEFNDREHREGVLSMARQGDPLEAQGAMPRPEFANTAGSQFFICLNYERTKQLDRRYTAFGKVVDGMKVVEAIAAVPTGQYDRPETPQVIKSVTIVSVEPGKNPYESLMTTQRPKPE